MAKEAATPPDEFLVVAAIVGDLDAFDELVRRYRAAVVRTAQAVVGKEFAEDVAQDALLLAFKALPSIDDPTKFAAWLGVITRHHAFRFSKREQTWSTRHIEFDDVILEHVGSLSFPLIEQRERDGEIEAGLEALPPDYATVLRLRFLDEMPLKRIAAFLGIPVSTVKWRVHRGKALMRERMELNTNREVSNGTSS
ncbi:MAG TPA: sigma-70 family RNA polymerase sigma factor [Blastocatellia bacterium]